MEWDLLRTFEAVVRLGSLTAAARALGVSQSTISRQLGRLEARAGSPLLLRQAPVRTTERGERVLLALGPMLDGALAVQSALETTSPLTGEVTLTTVGELLRWSLIRELPAFCRAYPGLRLRILTDNRLSSLAAGEADVALRPVRPTRGELFARRLRSESYAFCAAAALELRPDVPWLGLTGSLAQIPEQRFAARAFAARPPRLLFEDLESLGLAVQAGLGVAVLPASLQARLGGVVVVSPAQVGSQEPGPIPPRDFYLVVHRSRRRVPKVRAVLRWLTSCAL